MGRKVNPRIFQIGTFGRTWNSIWFARGKNYGRCLSEDYKFRKHIFRVAKEAGIDSVKIERTPKDLVVTIFVAKPGVIIGRGGARSEELKKDLQKMVTDRRVKVVIKELPKMELSSMVMVSEIARQLEKRVAFRRVMKHSLNQIMKAGAQGVKISIAGRLNGAEIARRETVQDGNMPASTLRADIDYARGVANTTYGVLGIKIWIYKGDRFDKQSS